MGTRGRIILSLIVFGAFAAGIGGAVSGGALRVPMRADGRIESVLVGPEQVFLGSAPAYPIWPPEPLYPRAERVWADANDAEPPRARVREFRPPEDLPPRYEVWLDGEERGGPDDWRRNDWRDDGRQEARQGPPPAPVQVYGQDRPPPGPPPGYQGPPPGYGGPPPGYAPPPPPPGYYGPPRG